MRFKDDDKRYYLVSYNSDLLYLYDRLDNKVVKKCTKDSKDMLCDTAGCTTNKELRINIKYITEPTKILLK